jgi:uncharacterized protein (UPF0548 family)
MFTLRHPSDAVLDRLVASSSSSVPTYDKTVDPARFRTDRWLRTLKTTTWDQARTALATWAAHRGAGVRVRPEGEPIEGGTIVLTFALGPLHVMAPCRINSVTNIPSQFGFAYATLPGHPEQGIETFTLQRNDDGSITFFIDAISRPADTLTRLGGPVARVIQSRVTDRYLRLGGLA